MDKALFGDNQFFGVNHMSEEKARAQAMRFQDIDSVISVLDIAYQEGLRTFMCTTHDRISQVCDHVRANPEKYPDYQFYPCMPYAHKYANAATEHGMLEALKKFLPQDSAVGAMFKGGLAVANKDVETILQLLVDAEMKMFQGLSTPVIFLQNVITDLILGLGAYDFLGMFAKYIESKYHAEPGFITMNVPLLLDALEEQGVRNPVVCANINKIGFRMCGGIDAYEEAIRQREFRPVAMSVLASGAIPAREAIEYVASLDRVESVVFGASSAANIRQTKSLIDELMS